MAVVVLVLVAMVVLVLVAMVVLVLVAVVVLLTMGVLSLTRGNFEDVFGSLGSQRLQGVVEPGLEAEAVGYDEVGVLQRLQVGGRGLEIVRLHSGADECGDLDAVAPDALGKVSERVDADDDARWLTTHLPAGRRSVDAPPDGSRAAVTPVAPITCCKQHRNRCQNGQPSHSANLLSFHQIETSYQ